MIAALSFGSDAAHVQSLIRIPCLLLPIMLSHFQSTKKQYLTVPTYKRVIQRGDTITKIIKRAGVGQNAKDLKEQIDRLIEADTNILALDLIEPKSIIQLWITQDKKIQRLGLTINAAHQVIYFLLKIITSSTKRFTVMVYGASRPLQVKSKKFFMSLPVKHD